MIRTTDGAPAEEAERWAAGDETPIPRRAFAKRAAVAGIGLSGLSSLLAACGGGSSGNVVNSSTTAIPRHAKGHIDLLSWDVADPQEPFTKALQARKVVWLKENPGASLTFQPAPVDSYTAVVTTRSRAGKLADLVELIAERYHEAVFPALMPLTRDMFPDLKDTLSLWDSTTISADNPNLHAGVPIGATGSVWYYNKAMFQKAGLDPDKVPTTWAEMTDTVNHLKAAGMTAVTLGGDVNSLANLWFPHLVQFFPTEADLTSFRKGEIPLTDERFVNSLEPLVQANKDGWWRSDFIGRMFTDMQSDFAQGKAAMVSGLVGGAVNWPVWDQQLGKDAYGVFAAPVMPKAQKQIFYWAPDIMYGINKNAKDLPAALSFINFLGSKEGLTLGLKLGGSFPNRSDIDVATVTKSRGAAAIGRLAQTLPTVDSPGIYLAPAATATMGKTLGPTIANGDVKGFLSTLQQQNKA